MPPAAQNSDRDRTVVIRSAREATLQPGTQILSNTYVIEACLGKGGMGEVYKAEHIDLGDKRAIKIILPEFAANQQYVQLFREEARKLSRVNNDAIVRYYEFARDDANARYLVMEFVDGESLATLLERRRLTTAEALRLLKRLAPGLAAAYEHGIKAHRDISPANIILPGSNVDHAKVIDFGIAKSGDPAGVTVIGTGFAGKYSYASPEQVGLFGTPDQVDQRSDIYSLGLVLAAAAIGFGKRLDMGTEPASVTIARQKVPDLNAVPIELRPILSWMLEPRPENRPQSMRALLDEVERLQGAAAGASGTPTRTPFSVLPSAASAQPASSAAASRIRAIRPWWIGTGLVAAAVLGSVALFALRGTAPPGPALSPTTPIAVAPAPVVSQPPTLSADDVRAQVKEAIGGYRCADVSYSVGPDRAVTLSGFVSSTDDLNQLTRRVDGVRGMTASHLDLKVRAWPFCEAAALLKPLVGNAESSNVALGLASAGNVARVGTPLVLDLRAPAFDGYAYIDYFTSTGEVLHLFPNDRDALNFRPARNDFILGQPPQVGMQSCWTLGGDTGEQLVTYVASSAPLFSAPRPAQENAKDYLAVLSQAVSRTGKEAARMLFFDLQAADGHPAGHACSAN